jgi:CRISPR/Cas system-associated exonuclease Cas4 (RecB family)
VLSKSDLQSFLQCPRKLWLEHRRPELIPQDDTTLYRRAVDGRIVGEKAREQLGRDIIWPPGQDDLASAAATARDLLASAPGKPAVEFPMARGGLYARADALVPEATRYILRETKASTFPLKKDKVTPDAPEDHHVDDVAIQAWVMQDSGIAMARAELNLLDNQWRYPGGGDYSGLFRQLDITGEALLRAPNVPQWITDAQNVLAGADMPKLQTGKQCKEPYPCVFADHCKKFDEPGPEHPIELLPDSAGKGLARKLRDNKGYTSILDPKPEELTGKNADLYRRIQTAHRTGDAVFEEACVALVRALPYPRYFFDFEGIDFPVPRWAGVRPYEQVPFQWSCHIERRPGEFTHLEFLDFSGNDPTIPCIEKMQEAIALDDGGPIIVYHKTYEKTVMENMAIRHPEHAATLQNYIGRLIDLLPIVKDHFYHPDMRGSFSIKKVLPVIAPDLGYDALDEVQEGVGAQVAYLYATLDPMTTPMRKADLQAKLLKYCGQDTWAMVEVAYFLSREMRPLRGH